MHLRVNHILTALFCIFLCALACTKNTEKQAEQNEELTGQPAPLKKTKLVYYALPG